ncbi:CD209 antigen-like protein E isoform X2 [Choloepus didactylus]|uniref:CD209 antigen-like protein E isoform X2 n=1 Tax=Choloepus didactylus TaxID=27675 RepID=UPI0018A11894|nr:CD209 antigen-like protein E isoform X2 [Choloepus didactylus]
MAEMSAPKEPDGPGEAKPQLGGGRGRKASRSWGSSEVTFWGMKLAEKDPRLLRTHHLKIFPGYLTRVPQTLWLILISLVFFMLLVTTLAQVFRILQSLQKETWDHQRSHNSTTISPKQIHSELEEIRQQLTWMNATLTGLCRLCPWNWEFFQGTCYFFSKTKGIWKFSVSACEKMGAQLVIVDNAEKQTFLRFWNVRENTRTWLGLSDHHNEGSWHWVDNSSLQLSFWLEGEPNNHENEDCVELTNDGWNDNKCTVENFWICEKPSGSCPGL